MADKKNELEKASPSKRLQAEVKDSWQEQGVVALNEMRTAMARAQAAQTPSDIGSAHQAILSAAEELQSFYTEHKVAIALLGEEIIAQRTREKKEELANARQKKATAEEKKKEQTEGRNWVAGITGGAAVVDLMGGLGIASALTAAVGGHMTYKVQEVVQALDADISRLNRTIDGINAYIKEAETAKTSWLSGLESHQKRMLFKAVLFGHQINHSAAIADELAGYSKRFGVTPDEITDQIRRISPATGEAFINFLKADYRLEDLSTLAQFAAEESVRDMPEIAAFLQFINHSVLTREDFFEIWASKMLDLENATAAIDEAISDKKLDERPNLELLGEKPISLSGIKDVEEPQQTPAQSTSKAAREAENNANAAKEAALSDIQMILTKLHERENGSLMQRHAKALKASINIIETFTAFYADVGNAVARVEQELARLEPQRDKTESRWSQAESVATSQRLLAMQTPGVRLAQTVLTATNSAVIAGQAHPAAGAIGAATTIGAAAHHYQQQKEMMEVQSASLKARAERWGNDEALKKALTELDKQIKQLDDNKELHKALADEPALEEARQAYMLLPRLLAGEANIDPLQMRIERSSYGTIDDFLKALNRRSTRLNEAMENFLVGLADSNDLTVIISEANAIESPETEVEKIFVRYVESSIKEHFREHARQASIVDVLKMRNVLYTGSPLHSFGEVVKMETDAALQALFAGEGEFSLVGSNDVHQIFGFYLTRHGERGLRDLQDPIKMDPKVAKQAHTEGLQKIRDEIIERRHATTQVPRPGAIFTEICAYEYFLAQGENFVKDNSLQNHPQSVESYKMVNTVVQDFVRRLALDKTRKQTPQLLSSDIESLIAQTFIDFFSELGGRHLNDPQIQDRANKVKTAYHGGNYSLTSATYGDLITEDAQDSFDLFLQVYKHNLEKYLEVATREKRDSLLEELENVKGMMSHLMPDDIRLPDSDESRERAHMRNHTLSYVGVNRQTWVTRARAIQGTDHNRVTGR